MKKLIIILLISSAVGSCSFKENYPKFSFCIPNKTLKHFAIYYGYPNSLNSATNSWTNGLVINDLSRYESVVFGDGLEAVLHTDHANTVTIISGLAATTKSYGYIDIGNTVNHPVGTILASVDLWKAMGVHGIFLDEFGMDYKDTGGGVTDAGYRVRQKTILDYVHAQGLKAIMNAWDPDDVFIKESSNPLNISSGDAYLYESYFLSSAARETFTYYRTKIAKLQAAKLAHTGLLVLANSSTASNNFTQSLFDSMVLGALADGIDGIAWGEAQYSAAAPMNAVMPFRTMATQANLYCLDEAVTVNSSNETLHYRANNLTINILYNSTGNPSSTITP